MRTTLGFMFALALFGQQHAFAQQNENPYCYDREYERKTLSVFEFGSCQANGCLIAYNYIYDEQVTFINTCSGERSVKQVRSTVCECKH